MLRILMLEDERKDMMLASDALDSADIDHHINRVKTRTEFSKAVDVKDYDLIISDYRLPNINGFEAKRIADEKNVDVPFILLTGVLPEHEMLNVIKIGLTDMVLKDQMEQLPGAILKAMREQNERKLRIKQNALWGSVIEQISDCILLIDENGKVIYSSPAVKNELGYAEDELHGVLVDSIVSFTNDDERQSVADLAGRKHSRATVKSENGLFKWVDIQVHERFTLGKKEGFLVNMRIVDEEVRAQNELRWIMDLIPGAVYRFSVNKKGEQKVEYLSEGVKNLTGYAASEYESDFISIVQKNIHPDDASDFIDKVMNSVKWKRPFQAVFRSYKKDMSMIWVHAQAKPSVDSASGDTIFNGIFTDITTQKTQEEDLKHISQQYRRAIKATEVALWDWDLETDTIDVHEILSILLGYSTNQFTDMNYQRFFELVHPEDRDDVAEAFRRYRKTKDWVRVEYRIQHAKGHWVWFSSRGAVVEWDGDRALRLMGALVEITAEKLQTLEIEKQKHDLEEVLLELKYQKFALDQHSVVSICDPNGSITYVNDQFCALSGFSKAELIGKDHRILNSGYHPESFWIKMYSTIMEGRTWRGIIRNANANGEHFWCDTTIVPFMATNSEIISKFVSIRQDVTKRKKTEDALVTTLERLESVIKDRTEDLEDTNKLLELKNQSITDSIQYAKYIQNAFLKPMNAAHLKVNDLFVWHASKDILSGDFHWSHFDERGNISYIVLGDCTGHGVPGSLMTMLSVQLIEQHVINDLKAKPNAILEKVNESMVKFLDQGNQEYGVSDGMEVALIKIDHDSKRIAISTAGRPVYHWNQKKLATYKLEGPTAVGGMTLGQDKVFPVYEFDFKKGDRLFAMSDGYVDQFGGRMGKKMMRHRKEAMLESIQKYPFTKLENLIRTFHKEWRGNRPQVDDVIALGVEL